MCSLCVEQELGFLGIRAESAEGHSDHFTSGDCLFVLNHRPQDNSEEQRDMEGKSQDEVEMQRCHSDGGRRLRAHYEVDTFSRNNEEEPKWGKGIGPDRGKKGGQDSIPVEAPERPGREQSGEGPEPKEEHVGKRFLSSSVCTFQILKIS